MVPRLRTAEYIDRYTIRFGFEDGCVGDVDLEAELWGEVFEPLKDVDVFRSFRLDEELNTVVWSTGADLAPEFLYEKASEAATAADSTVLDG